MTTEYGRAPADKEVEVTILGPGFGESIVIHIGSNRWIIIDSCTDESGEPAALTYLSDIGVDPQAVELVVATHWHDDHVSGLSKIVDACSQARFCTSTILEKAEFLQLIYSFDKSYNPSLNSSGTSEFASTLEILRKTKRKIVRAASDKRLVLIESGLAHNLPLEIWALSPSDYSLERFFKRIGSELPKEKETKYRAPSITDNETAVVILVRIGNESILLGADLEEAHGGWSAILESTGRPTTKSKIFKIPHHGSQNAHHDGVWNGMLSEKPLGLLTPYNRGKRLPNLRDVDRICKITDSAFSTQKLRKLSQVPRDQVIKKLIETTVSGLVQLKREVGVIRARFEPNDIEQTLAVEQFKGACHLSEVHS
ncbi:MBL fold metallo-hydrolase [Pseudomonas alcaligenes]|uniref:MBL fold metallo-hydrolase n=1 Tax=Aquipseudomonas alcaligenes TaxID=43263 RepID=UPI002E7C0DDA|nr:MBL fold metallo-hydrolase [Pseudomonas alcaligenes]MEE1951358.1 MBL fold metallo-hydrolase [Pseudomonas alcaligenes]